MILYTYSFKFEGSESGWKNPDNRNEFFASLDEARQAVFALREEVNSLGDDDNQWRPTLIEWIEIAPLDNMTIILKLLNEGIGPLVRAHEIVETIN